MLQTVPKGGRLGILAVTLAQFWPPFCVTCTRPSLVPAQINPGFRRDSAIAYTTLKYSTPMLSGVRPPEICCRLLSLSVKSGLISRQLLPPSVVACTYWLPTYTLLWSCGEMVSGASHTNRYLSSAGGHPPVLTGQTST